MVNAIILIKTQRDVINEAAENILSLEGISEVYSVGGQWDLVAIVRTGTNEQLADLVTSKMLKVKGIVDTTTLIAFRAFSKYDLASLFPVD